MIEIILILFFCAGLLIYLNKEITLCWIVNIFKTPDYSEYVHYFCSGCGRNIYIKYSCLTDDEKNYGIQCGKCSHMLSKKGVMEYDVIPTGSEIIRTNS